MLERPRFAVRYRVTPEAIKRANGLTSDLLKANRPIKIPQIGGVPLPARVVLPPRRTPPDVAVVTKAAGEPCN